MDVLFCNSEETGKFQNEMCLKLKVTVQCYFSTWLVYLSDK